MNFDSYGIIIIDKKHYYKIDLSKRVYTIESSAPFRIKVNDYTFVSSSWSRVVQELANYLIEHFKPSKDILEKFMVEWSNKEIFLKEGKFSSHLGPLKNGLYINANHSSVHLLWIFQDLLNYFKIDKSKCEILIKMKPGKEEQEVRNYFYNNSILNLKYYLSEYLDYDAKAVDNIVRNVKSVDKYFKKNYPTYFSLLSFESRIEYSTLKSKFYQEVKAQSDNKKLIIGIKVILDLLTNWYGVRFESSSD